MAYMRDALSAGMGDDTPARNAAAHAGGGAAVTTAPSGPMIR